MDNNPFVDAKIIFDNAGWTKGRMQGLDGRLCLMGSLLIADRKVYIDSLHALEPIIEEQYPDRFVKNHFNEKHIIAQFNDHPDTIFGDIEVVLEKAAIRWDEENE
jgi:hypothetical protein